MASWQMRFRSTLFTEPSGTYGSVNYVIPITDMPDFPFTLNDIKNSVIQEVDSGDLFTHRKSIRTEFSLTFNNVQATTMIEMRKLFREDIQFLFYEDYNNVRSWTALTNGTGTCILRDTSFSPELENDLFTFTLNLSETTGTKNGS